MIQDSKVIDLLVSGMRAEGMRQKAIANNIANMNTEGFRRSDVNFEAALSDALKRDQSGSKLDNLDVKSYQTLNTPINEVGSDVSLDTEVGEMVKNSLRHRTYMLVLKKKYQQMEEALKV